MTLANVAVRPGHIALLCQACDREGRDVVLMARVLLGLESAIGDRPNSFPLLCPQCGGSVFGVADMSTAPTDPFQTYKDTLRTCDAAVQFYDAKIERSAPEDRVALMTARDVISQDRAAAASRLEAAQRPRAWRKNHA